uniref:Uncharacterized protein n=1 Tax=Pyrodinium bahamense TaxID=73915 RepID=A0A7S0FZR7_9DINO|mmetsp:Transcript_9207/g.25744  ORF Transcript_9207/g.25744 Transcript_9207/m.25744 type:complete len:124 (+) Transcript_9207:127-498(+)
MRNVGPGLWREWRWGQQVVPLYCSDPKVKPPEGEKTINEVAYLTMRALMAKNSLPKLTDAISEMVKEPDSPTTGRVTEQRFRDVLKEAASSVMSEEELEALFPPIVPPEPAAVAAVAEGEQPD